MRGKEGEGERENCRSSLQTANIQSMDVIFQINACNVFVIVTKKIYVHFVSFYAKIK